MPVQVFLPSGMHMGPDHVQFRMQEQKGRVCVDFFCLRPCLCSADPLTKVKTYMCHVLLHKGIALACTEHVCLLHCAPVYGMLSVLLVSGG